MTRYHCRVCEGEFESDELAPICPVCFAPPKHLTVLQEDVPVEEAPAEALPEEALPEVELPEDAPVPDVGDDDFAQLSRDHKAAEDEYQRRKDALQQERESLQKQIRKDRDLAAGKHKAYSYVPYLYLAWMIVRFAVAAAAAAVLAFVAWKQVDEGTFQLGKFLFARDLGAHPEAEAYPLLSVLAFGLLVYAVYRLMHLILRAVRFSSSLWNNLVNLGFDAAAFVLFWRLVRDLPVVALVKAGGSFGEKLRIAAESYENLEPAWELAAWGLLAVVAVKVVIHLLSLLQALLKMRKRTRRAVAAEQELEKLEGRLAAVKVELQLCEEEHIEQRKALGARQSALRQAGNDCWARARKGGTVDEALLLRAVRLEQPDACLYHGLQMIDTSREALTSEEREQRLLEAKPYFEIAEQAGLAEGRFYSLYVVSRTKAMTKQEWKGILSQFRELRDGGRLGPEALKKCNERIELAVDMVDSFNDSPPPRESSYTPSYSPPKPFDAKEYVDSLGLQWWSGNGISLIMGDSGLSDSEKQAALDYYKIYYD